MTLQDAIMTHSVMHQKFGLLTKDFVKAVGSGDHEADAVKLMAKHAETLEARRKAAAEVSNYAGDVWTWATGHEDRSAAISVAENETLSEMARLELETGDAPGSPEWQAYYRDVNKYWDENS